MTINLEELEIELSRTRRIVQDWAGARIHLAADRKDQHVATLRDQTEKHTNLEHRKMQLHVATEQKNRRLHDEEQEDKRMNDTLGLANAELSTAEKQRDAAEVVLRQKKEERLARLAEMTARASKYQKKMDNQKRTTARFRDSLGLEVAPVDGGLRFIMTHVDEKDHDKAFILGIRTLAGTASFEVTECEPRVPGLPELVVELNRTNDLAGFVKYVRARFVQIARQSHGQ